MRCSLALACVMFVSAAACASTPAEPTPAAPTDPAPTSEVDTSTPEPQIVTSSSASVEVLEVGPATMPCSTSGELEAIVALLRTGQPTYDYQPAKDLAELGRWADMAVRGTVDTVVRAPRAGGAATTFAVSDIEVFAGIGDVEEFESASFWAGGQGPDPLAEVVTFSGLRFVGFFGELAGATPRWVPYVDGLVFGCESEEALLPFGAAPPESDGIAFDDFIEAARFAAMNVEGGALDGPILHHPFRPTSGEGLAALIGGVLELDGDCLYVAPTQVDHRFPILWPADTAWDAARQAVVLATGVPVPIGGAVTGSGGYFDVETIDRIAGPDAADVATRCLDNESGEVAVVNNFETAIEPG